MELDNQQADPQMVEAIQNLYGEVAEAYYTDQNIEGLKELKEEGQDITQMFPDIVAVIVEKVANENGVGDIQVILGSAMLFGEDLFTTLVEMGFIPDDVSPDIKTNLLVLMIKVLLSKYAKQGNEDAEQLLLQFEQAVKMQQGGDPYAQPQEGVLGGLV